MSDDDPTVHKGRRGGTQLDTQAGTREFASTPGTPSNVSSHGPSRVTEAAAPLVAVLPGQRYEVERRIGKGGMGIVHLCRDRQVGRRVAMKQIRKDRDGSSDVLRRFVREARVQAQLEHPSVVPVYDLAVAEDETVFFTMKRIRGVTLRQVLGGLVDGDPEYVDNYGTRALLAAFGRVCLAVDYAHEAGVVHRDLKPSNIMLGDFGEVYILDWGIARLTTEFAQSVDPDADDRTAAGAVLGTPGYMAPEQALRPEGSVGPTTDVYSLGLILFEILTMTPAHYGDDAKELLRSTLSGRIDTPSERAPHLDIAPELDVICMRATARVPEQRYASARDLNDAVERYLDGVRDTEMRRNMSSSHAAAAKAAMEGVDAGDPIQRRKEALREIGRALALDPSNADAMATMVKLLSTPPEQLPREVSERVEADFTAQRRGAGKLAAIIYLTMLVYLPIMWWSGIRDPAAIAVFHSLVLVAAGVSASVGWGTKRPPVPGIVAALIISNIAFGITTTFFGPLLLMPAIIAVNIAAFAFTLGARYRWLAITVGLGTVLVPLTAEIAGIGEARYVFADGTMSITPGALELTRAPALVLLSAAALATIVTAIVAFGWVHDALNKAQQQLQLHSWHFSQLLPDQARTGGE